MARYVFFSHDGFGVGHVRRNTLIAQEVLRLQPSASVTVVTGISARPSWLGRPGIELVRIPPLLKDARGRYRPMGMSFEQAVHQRSRAFSDTVRRVQPHVVVVDRHPWGTAGELREGLPVARRMGSAVVLGLRDVLDEPSTIRQEVRSPEWVGISDAFDLLLVYGSRAFCDHEAEYGIPVRPLYCGWVTEQRPRSVPDRSLLAIAAGGGGDGIPVFELGIEVLARRKHWRGELVAGPYADARALSELAISPSVRSRLTVTIEALGCAALFARAGATLQMAGYNSTFEALAAGLRPILVPRRAPRQEQTIRARRLAALGLADVVADGQPAEAARLLDRPRRLTPDDVSRAGIDLRGASRAAALLARLALEGAA